MNSETSKAARNYRLQEWAEQIRECRRRPEGMTVKDWCGLQGITVTSYYYRLRQVRKACLDCQAEAEAGKLDIFPVSSFLLNEETDHENQDGPMEKPGGLVIVFGKFHIQVTEETSPEVLKMVLQAVCDAE